MQEFRFQGNEVFTSNQLAQVLAPWQGHELRSEDLEDARRALTMHYVTNGYINSGAVLEDPTVKEGVVMFRIVEGRLSEVHVSGNTWLRTNYIRQRLQTHADPPLNLFDLRDELLMLRENQNVKRINAELQPGAELGTSLLDVKVEDGNPWHLGLQVRNDRPPSVGAEAFEVLASHSDLSGNSDALELRYGLAHRTHEGADFSGLGNLGASYTLPFTARETTLQLYYNRSDYSVIEEPFQTLDIESESSTYGMTLRQPLYRTIHREVALGFTGERRESETFLLGQRFSFSPGAVDGRSVVSAARFFQEWVERNQTQVLVVRSTLSWGLDVLGATKGGLVGTNRTDRDGLFFSWQGQAQYVRRLGNHQLVLSTSSQWANDPLLSLEQFSLGGANTVRGYRENQLVRDMGLVSSVEFRLAVWTGKTGNTILQLAPFFDYGIGWNVKDPSPPGSDLMSTGIGLIFTPHRKVFAKVYWGHPFRHFSRDNDLQDYGLHFKLDVSFF